MTRSARRVRDAVLTAGSVMLTAACETIAETDLALDQIADPDTNSAVVVLSRDVSSERVTLRRGVAYVYAVRGDRTPHTLLAERIVQSDTTRIMFVISDLYTGGVIQTDGTINRFSWTDPDGTQYLPVRPCLLDVKQPYEFGTPSLQVLHTACPVQGTGGRQLTVYAKAARYAQLGG